ncbi:MAG: hypothetical protein JW704_08125 [Anaerolineaceae bacterium]|nr:hypothetical protein [Anaerolineaceae bacterium]
MDRLTKITLHPILFALYPVVALFAVNIHEVSVTVIWRPLLISLIVALVLLISARLILRDWMKASLVTSFILAIFYSYGRIYEFLKTTSLSSLNLVRHRYLLVAFFFILALGTWWMLKYLRNIKPITGILNIISVVLVILPIVQITKYALNEVSGEQAASNWVPSASLLSPAQPENKPDVYYIILDTYARADRIQAELGYDNSSFIQKLEALGFYVAGCSRSNYNNTHNSVVSSLNMSYLPELYAEGAEQGISIADIWMLIKPSAVRRNFEAFGYKIVAFDTGFDWTCIDDADLYLQREQNTYGVQLTSPFEQMLMNTTPLKILSDFRDKTYTDQYLSGTHPMANFIGLEEFILDQLPRVAEISEPTFTFAHVDIPHPPYVFSPDGYLTDPGYWSVPVKGAVDDEHFRSGYIFALEYINDRMLNIVSEILNKSSTPPIIIIQGDHGYGEGQNFPILNAYYLPNMDANKLYPSISPVNSFRLIFNEYYGGQYDLLPDESFEMTDITKPLPEYLPDCQRMSP